MNNRNSSSSQSKEEPVPDAFKAARNKDSSILKINPRYQIQTRPYTTSEYKRLKDSVREIGQEQPIIIDEDGYILDGHHRLKICEELGLKRKWKSNEVNSVITGGRKDAWQIVANMFLANYRYTRDEDNWSKCRFGSVVYNDGAYMPRLPISERIINKVKSDRDFAHQVLCGGTPHAQKPVICPVCDRNGE